MELGFVAHFAPALMIAILLASARVARRGLNVTVGNRTDPYVFVGGRDGKRLDASELRLVFDGLTVRIEIRKMPAVRLARDTGPVVVDVAKPGVPGGFEIELVLDNR
jgi:hypothetical protein